ncbi:MAG: thermonuclease family protein [Elusimicrobiaceae bacterium]|nr:thermonuclease family protein [Elusimicrobiaceae bacterium]
MARRKRKSISQKQIKFWVSLIVAVIAAVMQQTGKPVSEDMPDSSALQNVSVASVYDGDTFKINLNCSLAVYCEKVPVRVLGVDCPEIKGKTEKEKRLAKQAKTFTQNFLEKGPISLSNCQRDKYFRLLCDVTNSQGQNLAKELIKHNLGYEYWGGTKSTRYQ